MPVVAEVRLVGITKRFGNVTAVDGVSLDIADRDFMILLGPSGCGKSTLLRMIAGLEDPSDGEVWIGDRMVNDVEPKARDVAMVFQSYALYPHKTVRANIEFPLKVRGVDKKVRASAAEQAAGLLGLTPYLGRKPGALSGGQRQRVALARAIVREPAVFCMDEPLSNLDAKLRGETRAELTALHQRLATTFVYVTHDQVEAMTMGSRIAVMADGVLQQVGTPQEVYDKPGTVFVATFLGTPPMNIFPAGSLEPGNHLVGVRPEHLTDQRRRPAPGHGGAGRAARPRGPCGVRGRRLLEGGGADGGRRRHPAGGRQDPARRLGPPSSPLRPRDRPPARAMKRAATSGVAGAGAARAVAARARPFVLYPLGAVGVDRPPCGATTPARTADRTAGTSTSTCSAPTSSSTPSRSRSSSRCITVPTRALPRRGARRARRPLRPRHRHLPHDLLLDRRHVGGGGLADVVLPPAAERRGAAEHRLADATSSR